MKLRGARLSTGCTAEKRRMLCSSRGVYWSGAAWELGITTTGTRQRSRQGLWDWTRSLSGFSMALYIYCSATILHRKFSCRQTAPRWLSNDPLSRSLASEANDQSGRRCSRATRSKWFCHDSLEMRRVTQQSLLLSMKAYRWQRTVLPLAR